MASRPLQALLFSTAFAVTASASPKASADAFDDAMAEASRLEASGNTPAAIDVLDVATRSYPQDVTLLLRIGGLHLRLEQYAQAAFIYGDALVRSPASIDAHLGVASALARLDRCEQARPHLRYVLSVAPGHPLALDALAACTPSWSGRAAVVATGHAYPTHPMKAYAFGGLAELDLGHKSGFVFGGAYRYTFFKARPSTFLPDWSQHEGYASVGYGTPLASIVAAYAVVTDGSAVTGTSNHVGLSLRWSPLGDVLLDGTASFYADTKILRVAPSWRIPIAYGVSLQPGVAIERTSLETLVSASATASFTGSLGSLWLGMKYGDEVRPASLSFRLVENVPEKIAYGVWLGGSLGVGNGLYLDAGYALERLDTTPSASIAHFLNLGLAKSF